MSDKITPAKDNNKVVDAQSFKKNKKLKQESMICDIIGKMAILHKTADQKLEEITLICQKELDGE